MLSVLEQASQVSMPVLTRLLNPATSVSAEVQAPAPNPACASSNSVVMRHVTPTELDAMVADTVSEFHLNNDQVRALLMLRGVTSVSLIVCADAAGTRASIVR